MPSPGGGGCCAASVEHSSPACHDCAICTAPILLLPTRLPRPRCRPSAAACPRRHGFPPRCGRSRHATSPPFVAASRRIALRPCEPVTAARDAPLTRRRRIPRWPGGIAKRRAGTRPARGGSAVRDRPGSSTR
ncbi:hypothetical protein F7R21_15910 [Burkholderia latens]|uniref:Uncharacterized protein n=1 Tax=Burkholderia latens TaxID=488446 RepID=A0A6H9TCK5_9BURK|nr:hypothetical protein F7R21_15910 [Burkholderia latens]